MNTKSMNKKNQMQRMKRVIIRLRQEKNQAINREHQMREEKRAVDLDNEFLNCLRYSYA